MTDILGLTSSDKIRAMWGITISEMPDSMIAALDLGDLLTLELSDLDIDPAAIEVAGTGSEKTAATTALWLRLKRFSTCFCAVNVSSSLRLAVPQKMGDGNNAFSRFQGDILEKTERAVMGEYAKARTALLASAGLTAFAVSPLFAVAERAFDPVVGDG